MFTLRSSATIVLTLTLALGGVSLLVACTDDAAPAATPPVSVTPDAGATDSGRADASGGGDAADAPVAPTVATVRAFDGSKFELPEGLAVRGDSAYVTLAPLGQILKIGADGVAAPYATVPPGYDGGYTLGLAFDASGALFVAQTKNADTAPVTPGIYRIPPGGGAVTTPLATHPQMVFPNGLAFLPSGKLLVTDSATGQIFAVDPGSGATSVWKADPALAGSAACAAPLPFPIGANGIVVAGSEAFVTNTSKGSITRIAIAADGSAGAASTVLEDCSYAGLDGLARDADGSLVVAQNGAPGRLLRVLVGATPTATPLVPGKPLDGPGSVVIGPFGGKKTALVTSTAFFSVGVDGGAPSPALQAFAPLP